MTDHSLMRLGCHPARPFALANAIPVGPYLRALKSLAIPKPAPAQDWASKVARWPMFLNDELGCCTCASKGHGVVQRSTYDGHPVIPTDADIRKMYEESGYVPGVAATDHGWTLPDALDYMVKTGLAGHRIAAWGTLTQDPDELKDVIDWLGSADIRLALPITAQNQDIWDDVSMSGDGAPDSWGGHDVIVVGYDDQHFTCVTWGGLQRMTPRFLAAYAFERCAVLSQDWANVASPWGDLVADFKRLAPRG